MLHAVIMAGGSGTRFWPVSTRAHPKQFLTLFGEQTMLQTTVSRIESQIPAENIWVITNRRYTELVAQQLPALPHRNIIGEPVAKNTAPCVAVAAALISQKDEDATMAVLPADHFIKDTEAFLFALKAGADKARNSDALITIGIQPDRPETGYGYIEFDEDSGESNSKYNIKKVVRFCEKPDGDTARQFIKAGTFLWNSGIFIWKTATILDQFEQNLPEIAGQTNRLKTQLRSGERKTALDYFYRNCPAISIDYGIMEKAENIFVIPGNFGWNDVGSWKALYELNDKDENKNVVSADFSILEEACKNLIHSNSGKIIALAGVENLAVVETDEAILVCNLDKAQRVKQVVNKLREKQKTK